MQLNPIDLNLIINAFSKQNFYIIGAGVSGIGKYDEISKYIFSRQKEIGIYPATKCREDDVSQRIYQKEEVVNSDLIANFKHTHTPLYRIHALGLQCLAPKIYKEPAYQYLVFRLFPKSTIFNLNIDGLADKYCKNFHDILHPHSKTLPEILHSKTFNTFINDPFNDNATPKSVYNFYRYLIWEKSNLNIENILKYQWSSILKINKILDLFSETSEVLFDNPFLPQPENFNITNRSAYKKAEILFPRAHYCIFIGYSFGKQANSIDDSQTFDFLTTTLLRKHPKPIIIIDPKAEEMAGIIKEAIHQKAVYPIRAYWDLLARAIMESNGYYKLKPNATSYTRISSKYEMLEIANKN